MSEAITWDDAWLDDPAWLTVEQMDDYDYLDYWDQDYDEEDEYPR